MSDIMVNKKHSWYNENIVLFLRGDADEENDNYFFDSDFIIC